MRFLQILRLCKWLFYDKDIDIQAIKKQGLLSVKIAQMFAMRIDVLSAEKCKKLSTLLTESDADTANAEDLDTLLNEYTDAQWRSNFSHIEPTPFAVASVGQVHAATLQDGTAVAIKLLKKDYAAELKKDVQTAKRVLALFAVFYPKLKLVADPTGIVNDIEQNTLAELNLQNEIRNQKILANIHASGSKQFDLSQLVFPTLYEDISNEYILVRAHIQGATVQELNAKKELPYSVMIEIFRLHGFYIFTQGTFHGDIHAGNIMIDADQKINFIDTGALAQVDDYLRIGLFKFMNHLSRYEYTKCIADLNSMASTKIEGNDLKKYTEFFLKLYKDFASKTVGEVSLTKQMMYTIKGGIEHGMRFERGMFPIIKSMMYLDAMVLNCNPDAKILEDMRPLTAELTHHFPELQDEQ